MLRIRDVKLGGTILRSGRRPGRRKTHLVRVQKPQMEYLAPCLAASRRGRTGAVRARESTQWAVHHAACVFCPQSAQTRTRLPLAAQSLPEEKNTEATPPVLQSRHCRLFRDKQAAPPSLYCELQVWQSTLKVRIRNSRSRRRPRKDKKASK